MEDYLTDDLATQPFNPTVHRQYDMNHAYMIEGTDTGPDTLVRQEFKDELDINLILKRHGVTALNGHFQVPQFTENDETIDLQQAIHAAEDAEAAYSRLPKYLHDRYPSLAALIAAIEDGSLDPHKPEEPKKEEIPNEPPA